jgi:hypothetical protein
MGGVTRVFFRAYTIVTCTALNVGQIAHGHYAAAFCTGSLLSYIWWTNTKTAANVDGEAAHWGYALGAGCGTITGMLIGRLLNG